jgi:YD repeat-containing protein
MRYDSRGFLVAEAFFDAANKPVESARQAAHRVEMSYDPSGNRVEERVFGTDGKPARGPNRYARYSREFDAFGRLTQEAWFDADGRATVGLQGFASRKYRYDPRGHITEESFFAADQTPVVESISGCARNTRRYNGDGRRTEDACYGVDGKLAIGANGYARLINRYDDDDDLVEQMFLGTADKLVAPKYVCARSTNRYERRYLVETLCYGADGKPATDRAARIIRRHDPRGNLVEMVEYNAAGKILNDNSGCPRVVRRYDDYHQEIERTCLDANGKKILNKFGVAYEIREYNERGQNTEVVFFGLDGAPPVANTARIVHEYTRDGDFVESIHYGARGNVIMTDRKTRPFSPVGHRVWEALSATATAYALGKISSSVMSAPAGDGR